VTAARLSRVTRPTHDVDLGLVTVLALSWLAAVVTTSLTLWLLIGVIGATGR
jgi:hypothetical protein